MLDDLKNGSKSDDTKKKKFQKKIDKPRKVTQKFEAPKEGEPRTKVVDRKTFH